MPTSYTTPGVYVEEISTFPPSVAEVSTAIPAFIGYTEKGDLLIPVRIENMKDYEQTFGGPPDVITSVTISRDGKGQISSIAPITADSVPLLYYSLRLYFDNGGGPCYIVPAGHHADPVALGDDHSGIKAALAALQRADEPTLIVMPDATRLSDSDFTVACGAALDHCGTMKDRFAILDVKNTQKAQGFRAVSSDYLSYGAAYTPYLDTSLAYAFDETNVKVNTVGAPVAFAATVGGIKVTCTGPANSTPRVEIPAPANPPPSEIGFAVDVSNPGSPKLDIQLTTAQDTPADIIAAWTKWKSNNPNPLASFDINKDSDTSVGASSTALVASSDVKTLAGSKAGDTALYNQVKSVLGTLRATLPPSGAVAGIYARVDRDRGVWKAPAKSY